VTREPVPDEEFESIPWDSLVADHGDRRRRWALVGIVAALVLGAAFGLSRLLWAAGPPPGDPVTRPAPAAAATAAAAVPDTILPSSEPAAPAPPDAYSEADLLALPADDAGRRAAAYASWFAAEYFTLDGSDPERRAVAALLPAGVEVLPADPSFRSFVEGVEVVEVSTADGVHYRVVLVVRSLAAAGEGAYRRQPVRMVEVVVRVDERGAAVADLPRPLAVPVVSAEGPAVEEAEPPAAVVAAALEAASLWGEPQPDLVSAGTVDGRWRLVVAVRDTAGLLWPVAVWTDPSGAALPAGG
jgi:hypothetical protein